MNPTQTAAADPVTLRHATELDLESEIVRLEERRKTLVKLLELREEVSALEMGAISQLPAAEVIAAVCQEVEKRFGATLAQLTGRGRTEEAVVPRHAAFWLLRGRGLTFAAIGRVFRRDHGSVMSGCRALEARMETTPAFKRKIEEMMMVIESALKKL